MDSVPQSTHPVGFPPFPEPIHTVEYELTKTQKTAEGSGVSSTQWADAYEQARALSSQMTVEEKANITHGFEGPCVGNSGTIPRLGIESLCFADGPAGIRGQEFVSAFPAGIHVAATFDRDLFHKYGQAMGEEYRGKGINIALGPVSGPLGRVARGGRNWEGLSPDPYLASAGLGRITRGMQEAGVMATAKHWLAQEQEWRRRPGFPEAMGEKDDGPSAGEAISSNVDDRTIHELYAFPFMESLREGVASIMCSYQRVNNSYGCQNSKILNGILKTELGFEGFVVSDWDAQHAGVATANAGMDVLMPDAGFWGQNLTDAVSNGTVTEERLTDMVNRLLAPYFYLGQDEGYPARAVYDNVEVHEPVDVQGDHAQLIREIGAAGTVLVKNENGVLPLKSPRYVSVYGYDAVVNTHPWEDHTRFGGGYGVNKGWNTFNGTLIVGGGSGSTTPPYVVSPFEAVRERVARDHGMLRWDFVAEYPGQQYANADACLVFINAYASEQFDRHSLTDEFSDNLVNHVAQNCTNTIVVIHSPGIRTVDAWIEHPNVTAVLYGLLPGQESGNSLVDVLWGDVAPSGKLPFTVAKQEEDYGDLLNSTVSFDAFPQSNFTEGLFIDYRAFDRDGIEPRFPFGFGLTYTTFEFDGLSAEPKGDADTDELPDPEVAIIQGGHPALWEVVAEVTASVTNTGDVAAAEVAQLYVGIPSTEDAETPARQLRGFEKVFVEPGETESVSFPLTRRDLSVWDVTAQQWRLRSGMYDIYVGSSSRDLPLEGSLEMGS